MGRVTGSPDGGEPAALLRPGLPARFHRTRVTVAPGRPVPCEPAAWAGALVLVVSGELTVEDRHGHGTRFAPWSLLALVDPDVTALHCAGPTPVELLVIRRAEPPPG